MEESNLKFMNNEHKEKLKELGLVKLNVKLKRFKNNNKVEKNLTVFTLLKEIYNLKSLCEGDDDEDGDDEKNVGVSKLVNSLTDEDIKNIINYIDSLDSDDITSQYQCMKEKDKIYHLLPISLTKECGVNEKRSLELKKESLILELMNWEINPFKIKECLLNKNNNFNSLNWDKICKDSVSFKKEIQDSMDVYHENTKGFAVFNAENRWDIPLLFLNYMYLIETFKSQNANDEIINLCYKNISNSKYIDSSYKDVMIPFFLIKYLEYEFGNQENKNPTENLLKQKNKIFVDILMSDDVKNTYSMKPDPVGAKEMPLEQKTNDKNVGLLLYNIDKNCNYQFDGFYRFMIPKFWETIDGLPEECIFVFTVEMMREVTLTKQQLDSVKSKIQNENLRLYLEKFNYDPDYKKDKENIISEGTKIYWTNYLCEKLFRGIGYLVAIIFIAAIHAAITAILILIINHWFAYVLCAIFVLYSFYGAVLDIRDHSGLFGKCVDFMQWAYDKTVGYWMKIWALHYQSKEIPEPENKISVPLNTLSSEINFIEQNKSNKNKNMPLNTEKNNDIKNNDSGNIEVNSNKD